MANNPEAWLESVVRSQIQEIDAALLPAPVYGQVPAFAAADRGVMDLLAVDHRGRLAVIELKASEDVHLPLQALDYWMRVQWHVERSEFQAKGYFPGRELIARSPRGCCWFRRRSTCIPLTNGFYVTFHPGFQSNG